jgi:hypothetical protein
LADSITFALSVDVKKFQRSVIATTVSRVSFKFIKMAVGDSNTFSKQDETLAEFLTLGLGMLVYVVQLHT